MHPLTSLRLGALAAAMIFPVHAADTQVLPTVAAKIRSVGMENGGKYDRFIVTYAPGSAQRGDHALVEQGVAAAVSRARLDMRSAQPGVPTSPTTVKWQRKLAIGADLVRTPRKLSRDESLALMQQIISDPSVVHVEPDVLLHAVADVKAPATLPTGVATGTPNDPMYAQYQWHMRPGDGSATTVGADTAAYANKGGSDASAAWAMADGSGVVVAVLDTGVTHHADLNIELAGDGYDFIDDALVSGRASDGRVPGGWDTGDWTTTDPWLSQCTDASNPAEASSWHGTHVSGTIAERSNNAIGMAGVAPGARVLPVRVLGHCGGYTSDIADAITWASGGHVDGVPDNAYPAQVISMSLGGSGVCDASDVTSTAITGAIARGTAVVVAAGNSNADAAGFSPASCPGAITVASVGITGRRAFYSNYGSTVSVAAPGGGIYANDAASGSGTVNAGFVWSTLNSGKTVEDQAIYGGMAGTSQATPHVAGTVALMVGAVKDVGHAPLTPDQIRLALINSSRSFPIAPDHPIGIGIVDASAAVQAAIASDTPITSVVLSNGVTMTGQAGKAGTSALYRLDVPAGARDLVFRTLGGTGDVSIYVKRGVPPTDNGNNADFQSVKPGNNESVIQTLPAGGTWYVRVAGAKDYAGVSASGSFTAN
jgi:serine protease